MTSASARRPATSYTPRTTTSLPASSSSSVGHLVGGRGALVVTERAGQLEHRPHRVADGGVQLVRPLADAACLLVGLLLAHAPIVPRRFRPWAGGSELTLWTPTTRCAACPATTPRVGAVGSESPSSGEEGVDRVLGVADAGGHAHAPERGARDRQSRAPPRPRPARPRPAPGGRPGTAAVPRPSAPAASPPAPAGTARAGRRRRRRPRRRGRRRSAAAPPRRGSGRPTTAPAATSPPARCGHFADDTVTPLTSRPVTGGTSSPDPASTSWAGKAIATTAIEAYGIPCSGSTAPGTDLAEQPRGLRGRRGHQDGVRGQQFGRRRPGRRTARTRSPSGGAPCAGVRSRTSAPEAATSACRQRADPVPHGGEHRPVGVARGCGPRRRGRRPPRREHRAGSAAAASASAGIVAASESSSARPA